MLSILAVVAIGGYFYYKKNNAASLSDEASRTGGEGGEQVKMSKTRPDEYSKLAEEQDMMNPTIMNNKVQPIAIEQQNQVLAEEGEALDVQPDLEIGDGLKTGGVTLQVPQVFDEEVSMSEIADEGVSSENDNDNVKRQFTSVSSGRRDSLDVRRTGSASAVLHRGDTVIQT